MKLTLMPILILAISSGLFTTSYGAEDKDKALALEKWRSHQYGMFIHFGMATYTGRANENDPRNAKEPSALYAPTDLDVDQWVRVARDAGMKYAVLTAKHTAGHCLWDSKVTFRGKEFDHDVATSGNKTDVVAEFVKACKKYGVEPAIYWCLLDFHNNSVRPGPQWNARNLPDDYYQFTKDQLSELIKLHPEVGYYWLDIPRAASLKQRRSIYDLIKQLRPGTVVLYNHGTTHKKGAIRIENFQAAWPTDVVGTERHPVKPGDFSAIQQWQGKTYELGYEHCDTIVKHWFWVEGDKPRPVEKLYQIHKDVIAAGGNFLLNVPPDRSGRIPEGSVKVLMELKKAIDDPTVFPVPLTLDTAIPPAAAREFRLNIAEATGGPTIWEFQLFAAAEK